MGVWLLIVTDDPDADPLALAADLLDAGLWTRTPAGWMVAAPPGADMTKRQRTRARQRAWRARQRDADASRDATRRDAGDADGSAENPENSGGNYSLPTPLGGREGVSKPPDATQRDATRRDAGDATRRDADARDTESWRMPPTTDDERAMAQRKIREMSAQLRGRER